MITPLIIIRKLDAGWKRAQAEIKLKGLNSGEQVEVRDVGVIYREQTNKEKDKYCIFFTTFNCFLILDLLIRHSLKYMFFFFFPKMQIAEVRFLLLQATVSSFLWLKSHIYVIYR